MPPVDTSKKSSVSIVKDSNGSNISKKTAASEKPADKNQEKQPETDLNSDADEISVRSSPVVVSASARNFSPIVFSRNELKAAGKGCEKDVEENEHFDPVFYKNQVAMRQHDQAKRPLNSTQAEAMVELGELEVEVIAKKVSKNKDIRCKLTVKQQAYLGSGAFSDVYKGTVKPKDKKGSQELTVAIKKIWPDPSREDRQIAIHRKLDHQNLIKLLYYYVCVHPETKQTMWSLILELMPSTVAQEQGKRMDRGTLLPSLYVKLFMYQTFCGLLYLEKVRYFHRDIKPDNLLVNMASGCLKIGDFGSARRYRPYEKNTAYQVTRYYRAPELCMKYTKYDTTVDIWAAGCILAEMLTNRIIFYGEDNADQLKKIFRICGTPNMDQLKECVPGHELDPIILRDQFPAANWFKILKRYNRNATQVHADMVGAILRYECNKRLRGLDALRHPFFNSLRKPTAKMPDGSALPSLEYLNETR
ncbi:unnamed protein product [Bursaphelenchus xylophilus]|uniref:(pine wood nematode) hypothetical protein n=1 Tax=Bursaphelenchus xylophilus TaxID=6326 RepID=A0A1I7RPH3_BURXY|nr:unnamed protein product [Bursaphelenchus xylophilus]CAG9096019.1 unnamed protein product [Bursaphelenchus xylophilus]